MTLKEIQNEVDAWITQYKEGYWPPLNMLGRLTEETGEVAREINHLYGSKKKKSSEHDGNLGQELCDIVFTIVCIANSQGIDLQKEWERLMKEKQYGRDQNRYDKK